MSEQQKEKRYYPNNPLGVIALFVFFIETINATTIPFLKEFPILLLIIVLFIVIFPVLIAASFFVLLWVKPGAFIHLEIISRMKVS